MTIYLKRAYEDSAEEDGMRILVDRLWPRGRSKEVLAITHWLKDIGPSTELRKWFGHDPEKYEEFKVRYIEELQTNENQQAAFDMLRQLANEHNPLTLVFAAKDKEHNQAVVLKELMNKDGL